ncbi:MAG: DUF2809 domain-containing protein [Acidobacteriota bacterium]
MGRSLRRPSDPGHRWLTTPIRTAWVGSARTRYATLAVGAIALGLAVHWRGAALPPVVRDVLGDALWAAMVAWGIAAIAPAIPLLWRASAALAISFAVELSQLYHAPGIDALRRTAAGQLALGSGFDPRDLASYAAGVLAAVLVERATARRRRNRPDAPAASSDTPGTRRPPARS